MPDGETVRLDALRAEYINAFRNSSDEDDDEDK